LAAIDVLPLFELFLRAVALLPRVVVAIYKLLSM
jgi:hypothetical protein